MIKTPDSLTIARVPKKRNLSGSRENYLEAAAFVARTMADANRLRILLCVHAGKKSVSGIVEELNLSQPLVSHHLRELRRALLVRMERRGPFVYYERGRQPHSGDLDGVERPGHRPAGRQNQLLMGDELHLGTTAGFRGFLWLKTAVALAGVVLATFLVGSWAFRGPGVTWQPYSDQLLAQAKAAHKPVILDFSATWCTPCRKLEEITFHHPDVVKLAEQEFVMLKVDLTQGGDPVHLRLLREYQIKGVPTLIFLDGEGKEWRNLCVVDYLPPEQLLLRLKALKYK
jgi:DNA-binding transcriptional ArsR family regulator